MKYEVQKHTIELFIKAYLFWQAEWSTSLIYGDEADKFMNFELYKKLSKFYGFVPFIRTKDVYLEWNNYVPNKNIHFITRDLFDKAHNTWKHRIRQWVSDKSILKDGQKLFKFLDTMNYSKMYQKFCKWFQKNITVEDQQIIMKYHKVNQYSLNELYDTIIGKNNIKLFF